jgi:hypothetical protein
MGFIGGSLLAVIAGALMALGTQILDGDCPTCPGYLIPGGRGTLVFGAFFIYQGFMFTLAYRYEHWSWYFKLLMYLARHTSPSGEHKPHELKDFAIDRNGELVFPDESALGWAFISLWGGIGSVVYAYLGLTLWFFLVAMLIVPVLTLWFVIKIRG